MIKSMTGFGRSTADLASKVVTIEIRSLNSKQLDLNIKLPSAFREKEPEIRNIISQSLERGKVEFTANLDFTNGELPAVINHSLVKNYYNELKGIMAELGESGTDLLSVVMKIPEVLKPSRDLLTENEWDRIKICIKEALTSLNDFREHEGGQLENDFRLRINNISSMLDGLFEFEEARNINFREKLRASVSEFAANNTLDSNRFEQEIIYYLEKLDITEEKVRLRKHLDYFNEALTDSSSNGRKLSFVTQEIGREINTIGSKANDANIQRVVVQMKDELEKIKEQLANIL
jgi:uncharacterized protein (TIGR00255 family)